RARPAATRRRADDELAEMADQQRHPQLVVAGEMGVRRPGRLRKRPGLHELPALPPLLAATARRGPGTAALLPELPGLSAVRQVDLWLYPRHRSPIGPYEMKQLM